MARLRPWKLRGRSVARALYDGLPHGRRLDAHPGRPARQSPWGERVRLSVMVHSIAIVLIALASAGSASAQTPAGLAELVVEGERWWTSSPDPQDPVACVTCHYDPGETRGWAASFPKYRPLPPPE